jgi:hypothetical protein
MINLDDTQGSTGLLPRLPGTGPSWPNLGQDEPMNVQQEYMAQRRALESERISKLYLDEKEFARLANQSDIREGRRLSLLGDDLPKVALNAAYLSHRMGRKVTASEYELARDGFAAANFGKEAVTDGQFFDLVKGEYDVRRQKTEALDELRLRMAAQSLEDGAAGADTPAVDTWKAWKEKHRELVGDEDDLPYLAAAVAERNEFKQVVDKYKHLASPGLDLLKKFTAGEASGEELSDFAKTLARVPREEQDMVIDLIALGADGGQIDRGALKEFATSLGQTFSRGFNFIPQSVLQQKEVGVTAMLEAVESGTKVWVLPDGDLSRAVVSNTEPDTGYEIKSGWREATAEERQKMIDGGNESMSVFRLERQLRSVADNNVDPIKRLYKGGVMGALEGGVLGVAGSLPLLTATAVNPFAGMMAYQAMEFDRMRFENPDMSVPAAYGISLVEGAWQAAIDRLQLRTLQGALPVTGRLLGKIKSTGLRRTVGFAASGAEQFGQELTQDIGTMAIDAIASSLREDMKDKDFTFELGEYWKQAPEVLVASLIFGMWGGGAITARELRGTPAEWDEAARIVGIGEDGRKRMQAATTPEELDAVVERELKAVTPESQAAGALYAKAKRQAAEAAQADPNEPTLEVVKDEEGNSLYRITTPDGETLIETRDAQAAQAAFLDYRTTSETNEVQALKDVISYWQNRDPELSIEQAPAVLVKEELDRLEGVGDATGIERLRQRLVAADINPDGDLTGVQIFGSTTVQEVGENVYRGTILVRQGAAPETVLEEVNHAFVRRALMRGDVTLDTLSGWLEQTAAATGLDIKRGNEIEVIESIAQVGMDLFNGRLDQAQIPQGLMDYFRRLMRVIKEIYVRAVKVTEAFDKGEIDGNFEQFLMQSMGMDPQQQIDLNSTTTAARLSTGAPEAQRGPDGLTDTERFALEQELLADMEAEAAEAAGAGGIDILDAVREAGGLPSTTSAKVKQYAGELKNLREAQKPGNAVGVKGAFNLFRKNAPDMDGLIKDLQDMGFRDITTPSELFDVLERRLRSGRKIYGYERGGALADYSVGLRPLKANANLHPEQQAVEKNFYDALQADLEGAVAAYSKLRGTEGGRVLDMDEARELDATYSQSKLSRTLHAASVQQGVRSLVVDVLLPRKLAAPATGYVGLTAGGPGSGKSRLKTLAPDEWNDAEFIYDGTLQNYEAAVDIIERAKASGRTVTIWYVHTPIEQAVARAVERTAKQGRALALQLASSSHYNSQDVAIRLLQKYQSDTDVQLKVLDTATGFVEDPLTFLTSDGIRYVDVSDTERRAQAEIQRHLPKVVPGARKIWLSERLEEADFRGVEGDLPQVWQRRGSLRDTPGAARSSVADLSVGRARVNLTAQLEELQAGESAPVETSKKFWLIASSDGDLVDILDNEQDAESYFQTTASTGEWLWEYRDGLGTRVPLLKRGVAARRAEGYLDTVRYEQENRGVLSYGADTSPETATSAGEIPGYTPDGRPWAGQEESVVYHGGRAVDPQGTEPGGYGETQTLKPRRPDQTYLFSVGRPRVDRALASAMNRKPGERLAMYERAKEMFDRVAARRGESTGPDGYARTLQSLWELDAILKVLPAEVRGKVGGFTRIAELEPVDLYRGDELLTESNSPAGARIAAWMREGLNIGEAGKKTDLPEGYEIRRNTDPARATKATDDFLVKRLATVGKQLDRYLAAEYRIAIGRALEAAKPKRSESGVRKSTLGPETQAYADKALAASNLDNDQTAARLAAIEAELLNPETKDEARIDLVEEWGLVNTLGDLDSRNAETLAQAYAELRDRFKAGRAGWRIQEEARIAGQRETIANLILVLGEPGKAKRFETKATVAKLGEWLTAAGLDHASFEQFLRSVLPDEALVVRWSDMMRKADTGAQDMELAQRDLLLEAVKAAGKAAGMSRSSALAMLKRPSEAKVRAMQGRKVEDVKISIELAQKIVRGTADRSNLSQGDVETLREALDNLPADTRKEFVTIQRVISAGNPVVIAMTPAQAMQLELSWDQPDVQDKMRREGWTDESLEDIRAITSQPVAAETLAFLRKFYAENYATVNPVYARLFGMNMPQAKFYAPSRFISAGKQQEIGLDGSPQVTGSTPGFAKSRVRHASPIAAEDALTVFQQHVVQTAHWVNFAEFAREARAVTSNIPLRESIKQRFGEATLNSLDTWVEMIEQRGANKSREAKWFSDLLGSVVGGTAISSLGFSLKTVMIQADSAMRFMLAMDPRQIGSALSDPIALAAAMPKVWFSPSVQRRLKGGMNPAAQFLFARSATKPGVISNLAALSMKPMQLFDAAATTISSAMVFRSAFNDAKEAGMSDAGAEAVAVDAMDAAIYRFSQPTGLGSKSNIENAAGPVTKMFTLFLSDPRLKTGVLVGAVRDIAKGKDVALNIQRILVIEAMALVSHVVASAYRDAFSDEEDEEIWSIGGFARAAALAPFQGFFLVGTMAETTLRAMAGERVWAPSRDLFARNIESGIRAATGWEKLIAPEDAAEGLKAWNNALRGIAFSTPLGAPAALLNILKPFIGLQQNLEADE